MIKMKKKRKSGRFSFLVDVLNFSFIIAASLYFLLLLSAFVLTFYYGYGPPWGYLVEILLIPIASIAFYIGGKRAKDIMAESFGVMYDFPRLMYSQSIFLTISVWILGVLALSVMIALLFFADFVFGPGNPHSIYLVYFLMALFVIPLMAFGKFLYAFSSAIPVFMVKDIFEGRDPQFFRALGNVKRNFKKVLIVEGYSSIFGKVGDKMYDVFGDSSYKTPAMTYIFDAMKIWLAVEYLTSDSDLKEAVRTSLEKFKSFFSESFYSIHFSISFFTIMISLILMGGILLFGLVYGLLIPPFKGTTIGRVLFLLNCLFLALSISASISLAIFPRTIPTVYFSLISYSGPNFGGKTNVRGKIKSMVVGDKMEKVRAVLDKNTPLLVERAEEERIPPPWWYRLLKKLKIMDILGFG